MRYGSWVALVALLGLVPVSVPAQPFGEEGELDPGIPTPERFLGYPLGERFTPHHRVADYVTEIARLSDRVELQRYGTTYEGRPLQLLAISSPENLARRDALQDAYRRLADPRVLPDGDARTLVEDLPVAVWLSFSIHGNEASGTEAALGAVYRLAAARDTETVDLLREAVVLIDPCLNPDGRDRYVSWVTGVTGRRPDPNPNAREHHEPWPGGRTNHYLFDLNRDWAWLSQTESRARAAAYRAWRPQVHVDLHEMWTESTYFFFPPERPIHPLIPDDVVQWAERFGRGNAAAFDARGWRYYTAEFFDLYYPGYGDSWPTFQGAIGMTYEQAGHGRAGLAYARADGDTLTLAMRAEHHYVAALTTVRTAVRYRTDRLLAFREFFTPAETGAAAYLFSPVEDPPRTDELMALLLEHGVEVFRSRGTIGGGGLMGYDGKPAGRDLPAGTYVVPGDQPLHRFLHAVLEPETGLPDTLFYDLSAWSLPLAFGVESYTSNAPVRGDLEPVTAAPVTPGRLSPAGAGYAYVLPWNRNRSARAAMQLQREGVRLHFAQRGFSAAGRDFPPGSLIVYTRDNPDDLDTTLQRLADANGVEFVGLDTGMTDRGPDLGSPNIGLLRPPRVALVADAPASPNSVGATWYLLDRTYEVPHSLLRIEDLTAEALEDFTVLVLPDDGRDGRAYAGAIDSSTVEVIRDWVRAGGVFVGLGGGAFFACADHAGLSSVGSTRGPAGDEGLDEDAREAQDRRRRLETGEERETRRRQQVLPGTIFKVEIDGGHPLGYGYPGEAQVLRSGRRVFDLGPEGTNVAWFPANARVAGYASAEMVEFLHERPFLVAEPRGAGHVVLYADDPNFRHFWHGLNRMFLNGLLFLPSL